MKTPKNFKFTAKFPKVITHDKRLKDVDDELERFFDAMSPLQNKTLTLLIQLPPSIQIHTGLERLRELVPILDNRFRYAIEVRHPSWFQDLSSSFFATNGICLVWNQLVEIQTSPQILYMYGLLVIGVFMKRILVEYRLTGLVRCREWADNIMNLQVDGRVKLSIIAASNHYAGFGPGTANIFRNILGLSDSKWEDKEEEKEQQQHPLDDMKQRSLSEFLS